MGTTYTARCGRTDRHRAHVSVRETGRMAPCVGNDAPRIVEQPAADDRPAWVRRHVRPDGPIVATKALTR